MATSADVRTAPAVVEWHKATILGATFLHPMTDEAKAKVGGPVADVPHTPRRGFTSPQLPGLGVYFIPRSTVKCSRWMIVHLGSGMTMGGIEAVSAETAQQVARLLWPLADWTLDGRQLRRSRTLKRVVDAFRKRPTVAALLDADDPLDSRSDDV